MGACGAQRAPDIPVLATTFAACFRNVCAGQSRAGGIAASDSADFS